MKGKLKKIMVVEDDTIQREELVHDLGSVGYEMAEAADADDAEKVFDSFRPDLVLMDIRMSRGVDGIATAGILRSKGIPFALVFITAYGKQDYDFKHARHVNPKDFLRKNEILSTDALVSRLEIAWNNYSPEMDNNIKAAVRKESGIPKRRVLVQHEEVLKKGSGGDPLKIELRSYRQYMEVPEILFLMRVRDKNKKQVKLFMSNGEVYRASGNLSSFVKSIGQECLVQINNGIVVNAEMKERIYLSDGDEYVKVRFVEERFDKYKQLPLHSTDRIDAFAFKINRSYKEKGALENLDKFGY